MQAAWKQVICQGADCIDSSGEHPCEDSCAHVASGPMLMLIPAVLHLQMHLLLLDANAALAAWTGALHVDRNRPAKYLC